jgi:DNA sulfur modification protein DndD
MILDELTLYNFCLFGGEQVINLRPARRYGKNRPVVLFGGINGGGKTTIMDAVQLALYGPRAVCSKRNSLSYERFLHECINRNADPSDGASVSLSFRYTSDGEEHVYEVRRRWHSSGEKVREYLDVCRDGEHDRWLCDNWTSLVEELIPIGISQLFFFDAEQIRFLADDETSSRALGSAIKSLLGLDLAERLIADAKVLEARMAKESPTDAEDEQRVADLEHTIAEKVTETRSLKETMAQLEGERQRAEEEARRAEEAFSKAGGEHWQQRKTQCREEKQLEACETELKTQLVGIASGDLPLVLVADLLVKIADQDSREQETAKTAIVQEILERRDREVLEQLATELSEDNVQIVDEILAADRQGRLFADVVEGRHFLSDHARALLRRLLDRGIEERRSGSCELTGKLDQVTRDLEAVKRSLAATPKDDAVKDVVARLKETAKEAGVLNDRVTRVGKQIERAKSEHQEAEKAREKLLRSQKNDKIAGEETLRLAQLAGETQEIMKAFLVRATAAKIDRLSSLVTESFRFLLRKKTLVEHVQIDPDTFAITLFDASGNSISKQRLSEGEKQIFAISVLWGLARASARPLPSIIDTPMARLDATHRDHLVERYFPNASHQVIVLSTDTEVDEQYFERLQPSIARAYHLDYDEKSKVTRATEGYFWESALAAAKGA